MTRIGNTVVIDVEFRRLGELADPDSVTLVITAPDDTVETFVYEIDDELERTSTGLYRLEYDPAQVGRYVYEWTGDDEPELTDQGAFDVESASAGISAYALRADVERIFGTSNVRKWADLENTGDEADGAVQARIEWACDLATVEIDDKLRGGPYTVPFTTPYPKSVVDICARIAGVLLYESRGMTDADEEDGTGRHALAPHRRHADRWFREVLSGTRTIGELPDVTTIPKAIP